MCIMVVGKTNYLDKGIPEFRYVLFSRTLLHLTVMKKRPRMPVTITPDEVTMNNFTITEIKYLMNLMMGDYHSTHSRLYAKLERMLHAYE